MFTVHVRVNDASTGRPTPVRLRLVDAAGVYRPPLGRLAEFATEPGVEVGDQVRLDDKNHAYIDGACEVPLPAGAITVQISKGPEYLPVEQTVMLAAGQMALRFTIQRWTDWRERGWFSGDIRVHDLPPHSALLEGAAEGLAVVQLLVRERHAAPGQAASMRHMTAFSGMNAALTSAECLLAVNTFNVHTTLGAVGLLNCHRAVHPLSSGEPDDWSVADWCDQCHRKKGLVVWPASGSATGPMEGEALAALVLGKIDAFEISPFTDLQSASLALYYRLLDSGFRPTLVGGSGKDSNRVATGSMRTYARLAEGAVMGADTWIEAVRAGRTFVTSGPLVSLQVAGHPPGSMVRVETGRPVRIQAEASSAGPIEQLDIVAGGQVVASSAAGPEGQSAKLEIEWTAPHDTWIAARCRGAGTFAHTSPVWIEVPGVAFQPARETIAPLIERLDDTLAWVETQARCPSERHREHYREVLRTARQELLARVGGLAEGGSG